MTTKIVPSRLQRGSHVRVVAPSTSLAVFDPAVRSIANERFADLGLRLTFGRHVDTSDHLKTAPQADRVSDLHEAFADPDVDAVITALGGYNSNQLLPLLNWDLIADNPKIFCGYSDITALTSAINVMTGLVTYSGPHYSSFGMRDHFDATLQWFVDALMTNTPVECRPSDYWTADRWYADQDDRTVRPSDGHWVLAPGQAEGRLVGGNLCTFNLLHGTPWMPDLSDTVVFVEDDKLSSVRTFDRDLTSLTQQPNFASVCALLIGRFEPSMDMTHEVLASMIASKPELAGKTVVANVDFGHTSPMLTIPVGGSAVVAADSTTSSITLSS